MVYPGEQWQTPIFKFTLIPQVPEAIALPPLLDRAGLVVALLIMISDFRSVLEAFAIRPLSLLGTPSRFLSVESGGCLPGFCKR